MNVTCACTCNLLLHVQYHDHKTVTCIYRAIEINMSGNVYFFAVFIPRLFDKCGMVMYALAAL